jgi:predicted GNAT superfamily acetyltransferase
MAIEIRPLAGGAERRECVRLQAAIWGAGFADQVPPSILMIAQETGGVASGAFAGDVLVGFVFGITGLRDGRLVHWSDMLAVRPDHRHHGLGVRLKLHQRDLLLPLGVEVVLWTFDPLVSRNAHLNLRRLGAVARDYRRDLYGHPTSPLHAGIGTDRLLVEWWIAGDRVRQRLLQATGAAAAPPAEAPLLNPHVVESGVARPGRAVDAPTGDTVAIAIPGDLDAVRDHDMALAGAWRRNVRSAFELAFAAGYVAVDLVRGDPCSRYVLTRGLTR